MKEKIASIPKKLWHLLFRNDGMGVDEIPCEFFENRPKPFTGPISDFSKNAELMEMHDSNPAPFTGSIPDFTHLPNLTELQFQGSSFTGTLPDFFSHLPSIAPEFKEWMRQQVESNNVSDASN